MALTDLYQSALLAHNRDPSHRREMARATHSARGTDALCGDDLRIWLRVDRDRIVDAAWSGEACAVTTAAASMLCDWLPGRSTAALRRGHQRFSRLLDDPGAPDIDEFGEINLLRAVGAFPSRRRNALLPWETALRALENEI